MTAPVQPRMLAMDQRGALPIVTPFSRHRGGMATRGEAMRRIVALLIAGMLLVTAAAPVGAINDGTSNTRSQGTRGRDTAGHHGVPIPAETREGSNVCIVPSGDSLAPPAR